MKVKGKCQIMRNRRRKKHITEMYSGKYLFKRIIFILILVDTGTILSLFGVSRVLADDSTVISMTRLMGLVSAIILAGSAVFIIAVYFAIRKSFCNVKILKQKMQMQIDEDVLTKAGSRRKGMRLLEAEYTRQRLLDQFDSIVVMVDIDHFKNVNDNYGHFVGDEALRVVVSAIRGVSRKADDIIRWGGDEFIVIYRGMTKENLEETKKRLRNVLTDIPVDTGKGSIFISASIGANFFQESDETYLDVIQRADNDLYAEKRRKNCVPDNSLDSTERKLDIML